MGILKDKKVAVTLALIVMIAGSIAYFSVDRETGMSSMNNDVARLYNSIEFKVAFTDKGEMKVFAVADEKAVSKFSADPIDLDNGMILGYAEANMMQEESLINGVGSELKDFFGIDTKVNGILEKTDTFVDDVHFLNKQQFESLAGKENVLFMKLTDTKEPKLFFLMDKKDDYPFIGSIDDSIMTKYVVDSRYPVILGSAEADMMIQEKLINGEGDTLDGFFGRDVIIIGILPKTGTAMDMMHFVPKDFFEKNKGVLV